MNLSGYSLKLVDELVAFTNIRYLDLSRNNLETLHGQALEKLPNLELLDLRINRLSNLNDTINALSKCHKLKQLGLQQSTRDGSTANVDSYHRYVPLGCIYRSL